MSGPNFKFNPFTHKLDYVGVNGGMGAVLSVTGTANQILASPTTGNVVLSLIGPYTPATYTAHGVLIGEGTSSIVATTPGTTGQVLAGNTGADPSFQSIQSLPYFSLTPYIVGTDSHSQFSTIQAAINQAVSDGAQVGNKKNIYIKPKAINGYVEDLVLYDGINLIGFTPPSEGFINTVSPATEITGNFTFSSPGPSMSVSFTNLSLSCPPNSNLFDISSALPAPVLLNLTNCQTFGNGITTILLESGTNSTVYLHGSVITNDGTAKLFDITNGYIFIDDCIFEQPGPTTASTFVDSLLFIENSRFYTPLTTSGTSSFTSFSSQFLLGTITHGGTSAPLGTQESYANNCYFSTGASASLSIGTILPVTNCAFNSSATNVITGAGELKYALLSFLDSSGVNTSTLTPLATLI